MSKRDAAMADGPGLADAIGLLRDEPLRARAAGAGSDIQLPVGSMTVELTVTATRSADGRAGLRCRWWVCSWAAAGHVNVDQSRR
jgi:hypothetical protein